MQWIRLAAVMMAVIHVVSAVNVIYDETRWTKEQWHKYKVEFEPLRDFTPSEEVPSDPALKTALSVSKLNSLDGPRERRLISRPPGLWYRGGKESAAEAFDDTDAIDHAAHAVQCTTCHALIDAAWKSVVHAIHEHDVVNEDSIRDTLDAACDAQVVASVLDQYTVYKLDHESGGDSGGLGQLSSLLGGQLHSMMMFVVRERKPGARRTMAEESAVSKACMDLMSSHGDAIASTLMAKAKDYYAAFLQVQLKHAALAKPSQSPSASAADDDDDDDDYLDVDDDYADPDDDDDGVDDARRGGGGGLVDAVTKALEKQQKAIVRREEKEAQGLAFKDKLVSQLGCVDVELLCAFWASIGECNANPGYMRGGKGRTGHCELSCGLCKPDDSWQAHPLAKAELELAASNAAQSARQLACAASKACLTGVSGTSAGTGMIQVAALEPPTPGALLAKVPGFVLGKPFWATPSIREARVDASNRTMADEAEAVDAVLHGELGNKVLGIPGMDGFFIYEFVHRQSIYHYHEEDDGRVTEHWVLGAYDRTATVKKRKADAKAAADSSSEAAQLWQEQHARAAVQAAKEPVVAREGGKAGAAGEASSTGATATAAGAAATAAGAAGAAANKPVVPPPFLEVLDLVPDVPGMQDKYWPYYVQLYTGGQTCTLAGGVKRERGAEVRFACSPDGGQHMLVREPAFCSYVVVIYSPALCSVAEFKPVARAKKGGAAVARKSGERAVQGGSSSRGSSGADTGSSGAGTPRKAALAGNDAERKLQRGGGAKGSFKEHGADDGGGSSGSGSSDSSSSSTKRRRRDEGGGSPTAAAS